MAVSAEQVIAIEEAASRSSRAFAQLLSVAGEDYQTRRAAHREYRIATCKLLDVMIEQNRAGAQPEWDIPGFAQPLVQQSLIEADILDAVGAFAKAARVRREAIGLADRYLPIAERARVKRDEATQLALAARFNEALTLLDDTRRIFVELHDPVQAAQTALDEVVLLEWLGDLERALTVLAEARALVPPLPPGTVGGLLGIGSAALGEISSILAGRGATGATDRTAALWRIEVELVEHEARVRKAQGNWDKSARQFESVLAAYRSLGPAGYAIEYQLAAIDVLSGQHKEARDRLDRIAEHFDSGPLLPRRAALRIIEADVDLAAGSAEAALAATLHGLADLETYPDFDLVWRLEWRRARALEQLDRTAEALRAYRAAAEAIDSLRRTPLGYRLDTTYLSAKVPVFEAAIQLAHTAGSARECAWFIELIKARALAATLSMPAGRRTTVSTEEREFDIVTQKLDAIEYAQYRGDGNAALRDEHEILLRRRIQLMEQIRLRDPRWRGLSTPPPLELSDIMASIDAREQAALTLYQSGNRVITVLLVDGDAISGVCELNAATRAALSDYQANLRRWAPDVFQHDFSAEFSIGADAFVAEALLERALRARAVLVAPHGSLHLLPWPALEFRGRRLFEYTPVGVLPNLSAIPLLETQLAPEPSAALLGAPDYAGLPRVADLPATGLELEDVAGIYREHGLLLMEPLVGRAATEVALRDLLANESAHASILHVSCHGTLESAEPMSSGLLLTDSKLDAGEVSLLRTPYHEVVLSACSTGWRPVSAEGITLSGDDVLGLPGALLEAGARSIVVSIPKAHDAASRAFMVEYHRRRVTGRSPLVAFRDAQVAMKGGPHAPSTWVGIVCYAIQ